MTEEIQKLAGKIARLERTNKIIFFLVVILILSVCIFEVSGLFSQFITPTSSENKGTVLETLTAKQIVVVDKQNKERIKLSINEQGEAEIGLVGIDSNVGIRIGTFGGGVISGIVMEGYNGSRIEMTTNNLSITFWEGGKLRAYYGSNEFGFSDEKGAQRIRAGSDDGNGKPFMELMGSGVTLETIIENEKLKKQPDRQDILFGFRDNSQPYIELGGPAKSGLTLGATSLESPKTGVVTEQPAGSITIFDRDGKVLWDVPQ